MPQLDQSRSPTHGFRHRPAAVAEVAGAGAATAGDRRREAASKAEVTITMLPDGPDVEAAVLGADGVLEGARPDPSSST